MIKRRKPLPYHASQAVDAAIMENTCAIKSLLPVVNFTGITAEERYRLIGQAIHHIHQSTGHLKEIRKEEKEE